MKVCVLVGSCVILASGNTLQGSRRVKNEARAKQFSGPKKINPDRPHPACSNVSETKFVDFNHERILCVVPTAKSPLLKQVKGKTSTSPPSQGRMHRMHIFCPSESLKL